MIQLQIVLKSLLLVMHLKKINVKNNEVISGPFYAYIKENVRCSFTTTFKGELKKSFLDNYKGNFFIYEGFYLHKKYGLYYEVSFYGDNKMLPLGLHYDAIKVRSDHNVFMLMKIMDGEVKY